MTFRYEFAVYAILLAACFAVMARNRRDRPAKPRATELPPVALPPILPETARIASDAWRSVWEASSRRIPVPSAAAGPDGVVFYVWNAGRHHLELEIIPDQPAEFFYRDRETGKFWGEDYRIGAALPAKVVERLVDFC